MSLRRRDLLRMAGRFGVAAAAGAGALTAAARKAGAIGAADQFRFGQLVLRSGQGARPSALRRMAWEVDKRTSISVDRAPRTVSLKDPKLHETPFLYLAGD